MILQEELFCSRDREAVKPAGLRRLSLSAFGGSNPPLCKDKIMKLVLFDVDGILLKFGAVGRDYWKVIIKKHFGIETNRHNIDMQGKTDRAILAELLVLEGIKDPESDKRFLIALNDIGNVVAEIIKDKKLEKIPNVENFVKQLIQEKHIVGLLTGNTREKARAKLENAGLWKYFKAGGFGNRSQKRSDLVQIALEDVKEKTGVEFEKKDVFLIGDTIRDIRCAKETGVKIVAVATGEQTVQYLEEEKPNYLFENFNNFEKLIEVFK